VLLAALWIAVAAGRAAVIGVAGATCATRALLVTRTIRGALVSLIARTRIAIFTLGVAAAAGRAAVVGVAGATRATSAFRVAGAVGRAIMIRVTAAFRLGDAGHGEQKQHGGTDQN
jgi:hypothetical protein